MTRDHRDPFEAANDTIDALHGHAVEYGLTEIAEQLSHRYPPRLHDAPLVLDIDLGDDPDGALALAVAAQDIPELALVLTSDEHGGQRARFARHLLDLLGRADVSVVAGRELDPRHRRLCATRLIPEPVQAQPGDPATAIAAVLATTDGMVRWAGCGPMTNLAEFIAAHPELVDRLNVDQLGEAIHPQPHPPVSTIGRDPASARAAIEKLHHPYLVTSHLGTSGELTLTPDSPVYRWLAGRDAPQWARLLAAHFDHWFEQHQPTSALYRTLTIASVTGMPFFDMVMDQVVLDEQGQVRLDAAGGNLFHPIDMDYQAFWRWLSRKLGIQPEHRPSR